MPAVTIADSMDGKRASVLEYSHLVPPERPGGMAYLAFAVSAVGALMEVLVFISAWPADPLDFGWTTAVLTCAAVPGAAGAILGSFACRRRSNRRLAVAAMLMGLACLVLALS